MTIRKNVSNMSDDEIEASMNILGPQLEQYVKARESEGYCHQCCNPMCKGICTCGKCHNDVVNEAWAPSVRYSDLQSEKRLRDIRKRNQK